MAANFFDQFDATSAGKSASSTGNFFDQFDPGAAKLDSGGVVSDLAKSVKVGVQRLPGMADLLLAGVKKALWRGLSISSICVRA